MPVEGIFLDVVPKLVADLFSNRKNGWDNNLINYYPYFSTPTPAPPPFTGEGDRNRVKSISLYRKRGRDAREGEKLSNIATIQMVLPPTLGHRR